MHQPAPGILFKDVALKNDLEEKRPDQPEDAAAEKNREQALNGPQNPCPDCKSAGIRADPYRKPSGNPVNGSQNKNSQCQVQCYRIEHVNLLI